VYRFALLSIVAGLLAFFVYSYDRSCKILAHEFLDLAREALRQNHSKNVTHYCADLVFDNGDDVTFYFDNRIVGLRDGVMVVVDKNTRSFA
jgi:hypothetical protein